jgi:hypothetical protein
MAAPKQNKMEDAKIAPFITLVKTSVDPNNEYPIFTCKQCKCEPSPCPDGVCCGSYAEVPLVAMGTGCVVGKGCTCYCGPSFDDYAPEPHALKFGNKPKIGQIFCCRYQLWG